MRIRALDVSSARVDGIRVALRTCTLAVRTETDGRRGWDASGWLRASPDDWLAWRADDGPLPVSLETQGGTLKGSARISFGRIDGAADRVAVALIGVGRLEPWPG